jgi:hypothetical protein
MAGGGRFFVREDDWLRRQGGRMKALRRAFYAKIKNIFAIV